MRTIEYGSILIQSDSLIKILDLAATYKPTDLIFIVGEKSTGKSTLAKHILTTIFKNQNIVIEKNITNFDVNIKSGLFTVHSDQWLFIKPKLEGINYKLIDMPTLAGRKADLPALSEFFLQVLNLMNSRDKVKLTEKALEKILQYNWPGQFAEFEAVLENAFSASENGLIEPEHLIMGPLVADVDIPVGMKLEDLERRYILQTLYFVHQNRTRAAEILGISIRTLRNKINLYRIEGYL